MPYRDRGPWHDQLRTYLREIGPTVAEDTITLYRWRLNVAGKLLGFPDPRMLTLPTLRALENQLPGQETHRSVLANALRTWLIWMGNRDAARWKLTVKARPKVGGIFLTELEIATARQAAKPFEPLHALIFSLGVDNGLRCVDMMRLTTANASELVRYKATEIIGKGRNGGKRGHLELSRMTDEPLGAYLTYRQSIVTETGRDWDELLVTSRLAPKPYVGPISYWVIKSAVGDIAQAAKMTFQAHDLRRTYGNRLHRAGVPIETVAKLMRHENINQSFRAYIGIDSDEMRAAQDRLLPRH